MRVSSPEPLMGRTTGSNLWLARGADAPATLLAMLVYPVTPEVLPDEAAVGEAQLAELKAVAASKGKGEPITVVLLGGRGAQAFHRLLGQIAAEGDPENLISRLDVFTQDALAPLPMESAFSFVRDFERLLGAAFFAQVRSFTPFHTDTDDLEGEARAYLGKLEAAGGLDLFFLGHGPEPGAASHLAYIKPGSGATYRDWAGVIPLSESILEHHIAKFKAGGVAPEPEDEAACRRATHILTLGPAAILAARRVVQSVVDAETAPAKRLSFRRVMDTTLSHDPEERARQLDTNPGLWFRLHPNARSLVTPSLLV